MIENAITPKSPVGMPKSSAYSELSTLTHPEDSPPQVCATSVNAVIAAAMIARIKRIVMLMYFCFMM